MAFLLQPRPIMLKPVAPSLLSDPAFSTDPTANPYAATEPWLSALKEKARRRRPAEDSASDSEPFHIIPPPNSPVDFATGPQNLTAFAVPNTILDNSVPSLTTAAEGQSHQNPNLSPAPPTAAPPPARRRITLMTILKRRVSHQPQSSASANPKPPKPLASSKSLSNKGDVTRTTTANPIERPVFPPRPVTLSTSTPAAAPAPSAVNPNAKRRVTDIPLNRLENLDRIDELDETNPWGIGFHHGGPYEAAAQATRGIEKIVFPGHGSFNRGVPQPNNNDYSPPQATGFSLNLTPGQILPRRHQSQSQQRQNPMLPPPRAVMMMPPAPAPASSQMHPQPRPSRAVPPMQSPATLPVSSHRQTYQASSMAPSRDAQARPQTFKPTPTTSQVHLHTPSPLSSSVMPLQPRRIPPPAARAFPQPAPTSRPVETHHDLPNRVTEDHLSPTNLVSIGIGMTMLDDDSDEDEEQEESSSSAHSQPSTDGLGEGHPQPNGLPLSNTAILRKTLPVPNQQENYRAGTSSSVSLAQPQRTTLEDMLDLPLESPPPYSSPTEDIRPKESVPSHPSSASSMGSSSQSSQAPSVLNQPAFRTDNPRGYPHAGFEDNISIHPSISSKSSSSRSSGPPPSRRVPKHLVMPTPLAQSGVAPPQYQNRPPLGQLPPQRRISQSLPHPAPHPAYAPLSPEPMSSTQIFVRAQTQEIHFPSSKGKLKKRGSLAGPSQLGDTPIVTTVSFAPPIIGFNPITKEDDLGPMMTEKFVHKRVLSKRKHW